MASAATESSYISMGNRTTDTYAPVRETSSEKLALVIPTLREAANLHGLLGHIRLVLEPLNIEYEILVVDDDSRDGTTEIVSAAAQKDERVRLLVRNGQRGLSGAILHGWRHTDAGILGVMDADMQHPPELLPPLLAAILDGRDLAIASRYAGGGAIGQWNLTRRLVSAAAVSVTWPIQRAGLRAKDPMSGFFLVRRDCLRQVPLQSFGFKLLLEILVRARIRSVEEIPFSFGSRCHGESKANLKVAVDYARLLAKLYASRFALSGSARRIMRAHSAASHETPQD